MTKRIRWLAALAGISGSSMLIATPAYAACDDAEKNRFTVTNGKKDVVPTNFATAFYPPGTTISETKSTRVEANASFSASVSAEAGVIFAKANTTLGVTVGGSWSKEGTWGAQIPVPPGNREARVVIYRESRKFTVKKESLRPGCRYVTVYTRTVNAPVKNGAIYYRLQFQPLGAAARTAQAREVPARSQQPQDAQYPEEEVKVESNVDGEVTD